MLSAYYGRGADAKEIFDQFAIAKTQDYETYRNQYDVIVGWQQFYVLIIAFF